MPSPLVSVVMPVRDAQRFLEAAICSVLGQTLSDFELLLIDDSSHDASLQICEAHARSDSRIIVAHNPGAGLVNALNYGLRAAKGRYLARMDADDICAPPRFERQVRLLDSNESLGVVGSAAEIIDENGAVIGNLDPPNAPEQVRIELMRRNCVAHPTVMARIEVLRMVGGYRAAFAGCEDYDLWLRISERADIANLSEPLLRYRVHEGQVTWMRIEQRILSELAAVAAATNRRAGKGDLTDDITAIDRRAVLNLGVASAEIDRQLQLRSIGTAVDALRLRQYESARMALALALCQPGLPLRMKLHCWLLRARLMGARATGGLIQ